MDVTDLPTLNTILVGCGCCPLPTCPEGSIICQSKTRTSYCGDDDYTDAVAAWEAATDLHDSWVTEHAAFPANHAAWVTAKADWDACMATIPCEECGAEPVEPVDPTEPPAPGDEPEMPEDYLDSEHGCFAPFAEPAGDPDERIPTIYRTWTTESIVGLVEGSYYQYNGGETQETLGIAIFNADGTSTYSGSANNIVDEVCGAEAYTPSFGGFEFPFDYDPETTECTETTRIVEQLGTSVEGTVPLELVGCPGPWGDVLTEAWDVTYTARLTYTLGSGITPTTLIARASGKIPVAWPDEPEGSVCAASSVVVWPIESDLYVGEDPEAEPPVPGAWPTCESLAAGPLSASGAGGTLTRATATSWRYKVGIPLYMQARRLWEIAHAAWVIAHARWVTCGSDPETEPVEPVEPSQIFHYFAEQWDVVDFPAVWETWRILFDAWEAATAAHAAWVIEKAAWDACELLTPGDCEEEPVEPTVPADPTADQPDERPEFVETDLFWEWTGGETEAAQYSDWYEVAAPTRESIRRRVNVQTLCWQSVRIGAPPTPHGETFNPDDYPA